METNTNRYRSRILREMHQNTKNPFNSPPSSTGSHGTVTLTSDISLGPGMDTMPRFEGAKRATDDTDDRAMAFNINTSVLGRTFPEWANYKHTAPVHDLTEDLYDATADFPRDETKENIPPASSSTIASPSQIVDDQQVRESLPSAAHVTPLDNDEILGLSPFHPSSRKHSTYPRKTSICFAASPTREAADRPASPRFSPHHRTASHLRSNIRRSSSLATPSTVTSQPNHNQVSIGSVLTPVCETTPSENRLCENEFWLPRELP